MIRQSSSPCTSTLLLQARVASDCPRTLENLAEFVNVPRPFQCQKQMHGLSATTVTNIKAPYSCLAVNNPVMAKAACLHPSQHSLPTTNNECVGFGHPARIEDAYRPARASESVTSCIAGWHCSTRLSFKKKSHNWRIGRADYVMKEGLGVHSTRDGRSLLCGRPEYDQATLAWRVPVSRTPIPQPCLTSVLGFWPSEHHGYHQSDASDLLAHPLP